MQAQGLASLPGHLWHPAPRLGVLITQFLAEDTDLRK